MTKIAIIGLGHISQHQIEAIASNKDLKLVAACDLDPARATRRPKNVAFYSSTDELLNHPDGIDLVLVSTPNLTHHEIAHFVLDAGFNVMVEKPAAMIMHDFESLCSLASERRVKLYVAFHAAFAADLLWFLHDYPEREALGHLRGFRCEFYDPYILNGRLQLAAASLGGSWRDSGVNALSVILQFIEPEAELKQVSARLTTLPQFDCSEVQGIAYYEFQTQDGRIGHGSINTNCALGLNQKLTVLYYDSSAILLNHSDQCVFRRDSGANKWTLLKDCSMPGEQRLTTHYRGVFDDLVLMMKSGSDNLKFARRVHRLHLIPYHPSTEESKELVIQEAEERSD